MYTHLNQSLPVGKNCRNTAEQVVDPGDTWHNGLFLADRKRNIVQYKEHSKKYTRIGCNRYSR